MFAVINYRRLLFVLSAGALCVLLATSGCSTNSKQLHSERLQILNTMLQRYAEGDSVAVYEKSIQDISISLPREKLTTDYLNDDSLTIPEEDLRAFQQQWKDYQPVRWKEWGGILII